jgi:hypothetical protein
MDKLTIAAKNLTPFIELDPDKGLLVFQGESYPENVLAFYRPVLDWIKDYFEVASDRQTRVQVQVSLRYMNTSSTKIFMMIFDLCQEAVARGQDVVIQWRHHKEDDLIREMGEDLSDGLKVPFQFIADE